MFVSARNMSAKMAAIGILIAWLFLGNQTNVLCIDAHLSGDVLLCASRKIFSKHGFQEHATSAFLSP